jgi:hypothetical protein
MFVLYPKNINKKKYLSLQPSIPKRLSLVKSAIYNHSPTIYVILIELMDKERLLIIKNKCINKDDIPYFFYLMKERLFKAFTSKQIDKEKYIVCNDNLDNKSISA